MRRRIPRRGALVSAASAFLALAALAVLLGSTGPPASDAALGAPLSTRTSMPLDSGWRFMFGEVDGAERQTFDDGSWAQVSVPHTWNATDGADGGNDYRRGSGWYRRHLPLSSGYTGRKLWLQFDGANVVTDVWVNGTHLGQHRGGYARFRFDATAALRPGQDNVVAVKVSNNPNTEVAPLRADFTFFGGLYRKVSLWATDPLAVDLLDHGGPGVYVRTAAVEEAAARVEITTKVRNSYAGPRDVVVRTAVTRTDGVVLTDTTSAPQPVASASTTTVMAPLTVERPVLWRGRENPHLYVARVEIRDAASGIITDVVTERFGIRSFRVDAAEGFFLNGTHVQLRGVNRHQDRLGKGTALSDADHVTDFDLMDEMGVNALRTAHYQQDQKVYDLADERGYVVWTEVPLVEEVTDSPVFRANAAQQMLEMIRQNYNHPSVMFWGVGNEQQHDDGPTNQTLGELAALAKAEDPDRMSTYAHHSAVTTAGTTGHTVVNGYNRYFAWYYGKFEHLGQFVDDLHAAQPQRRIALSEYGAGASTAQHELNPPNPAAGGPWHPEEYQAHFHEQYWSMIRARPYLWATFVWNMFDFAADQRNEGDAAGRNDKGLVTYDRGTRKDAFFYYKSQWTATPFIHLTSARWTDRTAAATAVKVYGRADSVTLRLNGTDVGGPVPLTDGTFTWPDVTLRPGVNTVEVVAVQGGTTYTDKAEWTLKV